MLGDELKKCQVVDSVGEKIGKVKDVIVDTTKEKWVVKGIVVSTGIIGKDVLFNIEDIGKIGEDEKTIDMKEGAEKREIREIFSPEYIPMEIIQEREVFSSDEEKVGDIYDYVVTTELTPWEIWKVLIRPSEKRLIGRRMRIDTKDISQIKDKIVVKWLKEEIEEMSGSPEDILGTESIS